MRTVRLSHGSLRCFSGGERLLLLPLPLPLPPLSRSTLCRLHRRLTWGRVRLLYSRSLSRGLSALCFQSSTRAIKLHVSDAVCLCLRNNWSGWFPRLLSAKMGRRKRKIFVCQDNLIPILLLKIAFMNLKHSFHLFTKTSKGTHIRTCGKTTLFKIIHVVLAQTWICLCDDIKLL